MAERIPLAIVGCGGMGHRHLFGLDELERAGRSPFELVGTCDPQLANAQSLADEAEKRLGKRPEAVASLDQLPAGVAAIDLPAAPRVHHTVGVEALERGWHVMCEKPVGLTVRACQLLLDAARGSGKVLSVAENYRRDPINRLAKALIDQGVLGQPRLMVQNTLGGGDTMLISVWRHQKAQSGLLLDVGVHFTDMMEYLLGPITSVYAQTRLHEKYRHNPAAGGKGSKGHSPAGVYERWQKEMPSQFEATADDACYATLLFANGAVAQYIEDHAVRGRHLWQRSVYGSLASLDLPGDRSGDRLRLTLPGREPVDDDALFEFVPDFALEETTAALFGADRLSEYTWPFAETDRKLIAVEYRDFGEAILTGRPPEVDGAQGTRSVALCYAMLESQVAGRHLSLDEVLADQTNAYQAEINQSLGL